MTVPGPDVLGSAKLPDEWGVLVLVYGEPRWVLVDKPALNHAVIERGPTRINHWQVAAAGRGPADRFLTHEWRLGYQPRPAAARAHRTAAVAARARRARSIRTGGSEPGSQTG